MLVALFIKIVFVCANKPQIKEILYSVHSGGLVTWNVPLYHIGSLYRKESSLWIGIKRTQSLRRTRLMGLHFSVWSGGSSMPSCPMSCCKFSCKNHRGAMQTCLRVSIIKFSQATRIEKQIKSSKCTGENFPPRYLSFFFSVPSIFCCTVVLTCH